MSRKIALPLLVGNMFQQLYNTADALIVGRFLGDEALAAVSASGPLIFLLISFCLLRFIRFCILLTILIYRYVFYYIANGFIHLCL